MPEKVIDIPGVGPTAFPDSMSEQEINAAATRAYQEANPGKKQPPVKSWADTAVDALPAVAGVAGAALGGAGGTAFGMGFGGIPGAAGGAALGTGAGEAAKQLINRVRGAEAPSTSGEAAADIAVPAASAAAGTAALGYGLPAAANVTARLATNPDVAKTVGTVARTAVTLGALGHGIKTGNISEIVAAPIAGWQAGKGGYFLGKGAQSLAAPVASILASVAPYAQSLATIGGSAPAPLAEMLAGKVRQGIEALMHYGLSREDAVKAISDQTIRR